MQRPKGVFERYLDAMQKTGDIMLRYQYQRDMIRSQILTPAEWDKLVDDVTNNVISNISATVDVSEIIMQIEEVEKKLNELGG